MPPWSPSGAWSLRDVREPTGSIEVELASAAPPEAKRRRGEVRRDAAPGGAGDGVHGEERRLAVAGGSVRRGVHPPPREHAGRHLRRGAPGLRLPRHRSRALGVRHRAPDFMSRSSSATTLARRWATKGFDAVLSGGGGGGAGAQEADGEEDDDYKRMTEEMCRIYSHAPRQFTIIDRVRT